MNTVTMKPIFRVVKRGEVVHFLWFIEEISYKMDAGNLEKTRGRSSFLNLSTQKIFSEMSLIFLNDHSVRLHPARWGKVVHTFCLHCVRL